MFVDNMLPVMFSLFSLLCFSSTQATVSSEAPSWPTFESTVDFRTTFYDKETNRLYVGGVNTIYEFDPENIIRPLRQLAWAPEPLDQETCLSYKDDEMLCQNNIGVVVASNSSHLFACGTMAYEPTCTFIEKETFTKVGNTENGRWKTPFDPYVSTVSVMANETLFTATLGNMQGNDGILSRTLNGITLRTEENDKYWLNDPIFLDGHHIKNRDPAHDKVMLFFREKAEEFQPYMYGMATDPEQRNVVSRVATVCVNDHGGTRYVLHRKFATFTKMSIECHSKPDANGAVFRYTHLESTFILEDPNDPTNPTVFGIFTMPNGAIAGTAVCAFNMSEVKRSLATNQYWNRQQMQHGPKSNFTGMKELEPGNCVGETRDLSHSRLSFSEKHPVKFGSIYPSFDRPHYQESGVRYRHIAVDQISSEKSTFGRAVTVIYMITSHGLLKRVVHEASDPPRSWALPDIQIEVQVGQLAKNECVIDMVLAGKYLHVITNRTITQIPLAACSLYTCQQCQEAADPYCALSRDGVCESVFGKSPTEVAEISTYDVVCPPAPTPSIKGLVQQQIQKIESCNLKMLQQNDTIRNLTMQVEKTKREAENRKSAREYTSTQLGVCLRQRNYVLRKAAELSSEVERRMTKEQYDKEVRKLKQTSALTDRLLHRRRQQIYNLTGQVNNCHNDLRAAHRRVVATNITCEEEKQKAIESVNKKMKTMIHKMSAMHDKAKGKEESLNSALNRVNVTSKKCQRRKKAMVGQIAVLRKSSKNKSRMVDDLTNERIKQERLIRQLSELQKRNEQKDQNCDQNGWFLSNATGNQYLLGKRRASFEESIRICQLLDAELAMFKDRDELRYINKVIRAFEPTRHFWIGLTKYSNSTLQWVDGSRLNDEIRPFPATQTNRFRRRVTFCTEITASLNWGLIPCARVRRPICLKRAHTVSPPQGLNTARLVEGISTIRKSS